MDERESRMWRGYISSRSDAARNALVEHYLPVIRNVARKVAARIPPNCGVDAGDLVSAGTIGCMQAIERFDPSRGLKFTTFAAPRIRGAMVDELRRWDYLSRSHRRDVGTGDSPEITNISLSTSLTETENREIALQETIPADVMPPDHRLSQGEYWGNMLRGADKMTRLILLLYYRDERTMKQIGQSLGLSESRVSQITKLWMGRMGDRVRREIKQGRLQTLLEEEVARMLRSPDPREWLISRVQHACSGSRCRRPGRPLADHTIRSVVGQAFDACIAGELDSVFGESPAASAVPNSGLRTIGG